MGKEPKGQDEADRLGDEVISGIARRIVELRKKKGLTQGELGKLAGVTQGRIFELEQRTSNITVRTLVRMAHVLGVELSELMFDVPPVSDARLVDALDRWTKALEQRTAYDEALVAEIRPIIGSIKEIAIRKPGEDKADQHDDGPPSASKGVKKAPRKTTHT